MFGEGVWRCDSQAERVWMRIFVFLYTCINVTSNETVNILPSPNADVHQYHSLKLTCTYTGSGSVVLLNWYRNGVEFVVFSPDETGQCRYFSGANGSALDGYEYSCDPQFTWTIKNVTNKIHGENWSCIIKIREEMGKEMRSTPTYVFVKVPVKSVTMLIPAGDSISVTENVPEQFSCVTSVERPRSTIRWYRRGIDTSIGTGTVSPSNENILSSTTSTFTYTFNRTHNATELYCTANNTADANPVPSSSKDIIVQYGTDGGPEIVGFEHGDMFDAIESVQQSLTCYVTGGSPPPALSWECFSGIVTDRHSNQTEVRQSLTWTPSVGSDLQKCKCISFQAVSRRQVFELAVNVLYQPSKPTFTVGGTTISEAISVIRGRIVTVQCESSGNPSPEYFWTNNRTLDTSNKQTLTLGDTNTSEDGAYTCTASNTMKPSSGNEQVGSNTSFFLLDVLNSPDTPILKVEQQTISANLSIVRGDNILVTCESTSDPGPPSVYWVGQTAGNGSSVLSTKYIQSTGVRSCKARNTMFPTFGMSEDGTAQADLYINVMREPTVPKLKYLSSIGLQTDLQTSELVVIKGTSFSVQCFGSTSMPGPPIYSWTGNKGSSSDSISFTEVGKQDPGGTSTCHVKNTMVRTIGELKTGRNSTPLEVEIHYPPDIDSLNEMTVVENEQLTITCTARSFPLPSSYNWTRSKDDFYQQSSILNIIHTRREDADKYTCTVQNKMMPTVEGDKSGVANGTVSVKILYFPDVDIYQPNGTNVTEGDANVILMCEANGDPNTYTFGNWTHFAPDGMTKIKEYTAVELEEGRVQLKFTAISYMDSGIFECNVSNGISDYKTGNNFATCRATQTVKGPPILGKIERLVTAAIQSNATLTVRYYSKDGTDPEISWYRLEKNNTKSKIMRDGERIFYDNGADNILISFYDVEFYQSGNVSRLFILNVTADDFHDYEIEISNDIEKTVARIQFISKSSPETPRDFDIVPGSTTSSRTSLTWMSGFHGGANQTFIIQYKTSSTDWQNGPTVEGFSLIDTVFNATVERLSSETKYIFRIYAENVFGNSSTRTATATTRSDAEDLVSSPNVGLIAGGAAGGIVLAAIIVVLVLLVHRRRQDYFNSRSKRLLKDNERPVGTNGADDTPEINLNPMYESAGPLPSISNNSDVYSQVDKNKKKSKARGDIYSQVDKPKIRLNTGGSEVKNDVYAQVQKKNHKEKHADNTKHKKQKPDKKTKKEKQTEGDLYDNVDPLDSAVSKGDNIYENPSCSIEDEQPKQMGNQGGLIYADLELPKETVGKDRKVVIHGLEDRTDYADIKFGEVGEQAPESDEENTNKDG